MFKSYLKSLYRNISRNKFYTLFNVIGLAIGLTTALFILLYIQDDLSYDKHYQNHNRIYRLESAFTVNNNVDRFATFPVPLGPALKNEIPDIEEMARIKMASEMLIKYKDHQFYEWDFAFADSTLFEVFSHEFIMGNPENALTEPNSIVLTESLAIKYFGDEDPFGKAISDGTNTNYRVTGIIKDLPANTHLKYDALISMSTHPDIFSITKPSRFWRVSLFTYVLLNEQSDIENLQDKFLDFYINNMEPLGKRFNVSFELLSTSLTKTHFKKGLLSERPTGNTSYLIIFSAIALFILFIAAVNYMNMATARSANRSKEVGVRKVLGADKPQLIRQFLGESLILTSMALILAFITVWILLGDFNEFTDKAISFNPVKNLMIFIEIIFIALLTGLLSGSYPAFYLSSFAPVLVLKGRLSKSGKTNRYLRRILVTLQFLIAVLMIISSFVISGQLDFLKEKDLGYNKDDVIIIQIDDENFRQRINTFKNEILQNSSIISVSNSYGVPGIIPYLRSMKVESEEGMKDESLLYVEADFDFIDTYQMKIGQGRDFSKAMGTDSLSAALINEAAAYKLGWINNPIGKRIHHGYKQDGTGGRMLKVVGVINDFNFRSLHNEIDPIVVMIQENPGSLLSVRITPENKDETINYLENKWNEFGSAYPFRYEYLEDQLDEMYTNDEKIGVIIKLATLITIVLALLGLLGLSSFIAEQKTKEIGIRKIHGATLSNILLLLYREFIYLFVIAFVIAAPIAWWRLGKWLESEFSYYQDLSGLIFLYAGILAIVVGLATISFFIIRAALGNPVKAIKYE